MKRNEACALLTKIALNELIDEQVSKDLLKARDIVVCEPNKVLDVLSTLHTKCLSKEYLLDYISDMLNDNIFSQSIQRDLYYLQKEINGESKFEGKCTEMYLETRCKNCPNYAGN